MPTFCMIPGDGIGPEVTEAARLVMDAAGVKIDWKYADLGESAMGKYNTPVPDETIEQIRNLKIALKGPTTTPIGTGFRSANVAIRLALDLYANLRPVRSLPGTKARYEDIDLTVVRENTEDLYAGIERMVNEDKAESIKIITRGASRRICEFAFRHAVSLAASEAKTGAVPKRRTVTAVHKANIMKFTDGLFLEEARKVAEQYPEIEYEELIVDNTAMQMVLRPERFDVMVMPNLYGDILSDLASGLIGGLGVAAGGNIGDECAVFEPVHGSVPRMTGQGIANPIACILGGAMLLEHAGEVAAGKAIYSAVERVLADGKVKTRDLGGESSTMQLAERIAKEVSHRQQ